MSTSFDSNEKTLLRHPDIHRCANLKLGSSQRRGSPLMNGFGHHGLKADQQSSEVLLCSDRIVRCFHGEGHVIGGLRAQL